MDYIFPHVPRGRPKSEIDLTTVERAASLGCTMDEIAVLIGVSRATLYNHLDEDQELKDAIEKGRQTGRTTLRRLQWDKAQQGSDTMLIWLGKQLLDQRDNAAVVMTGPNGGPVQSQTTVRVDPIEASRAYQRLMSGE